MAFIFYFRRFIHQDRENEIHWCSNCIPVSITLVGCYSSDERLIDCAYHDFPSDSTISMDVSISCQGSSDDNEISHLRSVSTASLTLTVLLAVAAIVVVVVLVVIFVLRQRKKRYDPR